MPIRLATVTEAQWLSTAQAYAEAGNPLVALWGSDRRSVAEGFVVWASYATQDGLAVLRLQVQGEPAEYPALQCYPSATRMQRALFDRLGSRAGDAGESSLDDVAISAELRATLESVAPIYRRHWWPEHDRANRVWIAAAEPPLHDHGKEIAERVSRSYGEQWPSDPIRVDLTMSAGPNGAYAAFPLHVTISSVDAGHQGLAWVPKHRVRVAALDNALAVALDNLGNAAVFDEGVRGPAVVVVEYPSLPEQPRDEAVEVLGLAALGTAPA
jgi:hypothetical protein